jgi:opacity protein-like surface antigen
MMRIGIFIGGVLFVFSTATAQVRVGFSGGILLSGAEQIRFYNSKAYSTTTYFWSGIIDCSITEGLSVMLTPSYAEKGTYALPVEVQGYVPKLSFRQTYVEFPLLLKYSFGSTIRPHLVVGTTVGVNLSSRVAAEVHGPALTRIELEADAASLVRDFEYSLEFGGGVSYEIDEYIMLTIEGRYSHGLSNIVRKGSVAKLYNDDFHALQLENEAVYKSKGFKISLGLTFPLEFDVH